MLSPFRSPCPQPNQPTNHHQTVCPAMYNNEQGTPVDLSVAQWIRRHQAISNAPGAHQSLPAFRAAEWALTGYDRAANEQGRIEALRNRPIANGTMPYIRRDYDSLIGFTSHIPVKSSLFLYVRPNATRALTERLKIKAPFWINDEVSFHPIQSHYLIPTRHLRRSCWILPPSQIHCLPTGVYGIKFECSFQGSKNQNERALLSQLRSQPSSMIQGSVLPSRWQHQPPSMIGPLRMHQRPSAHLMKGDSSQSLLVSSVQTIFKTSQKP